MIAWLARSAFETFLVTGALIALVLVLRRPVARHFGPQTSYALWALPLLRFAMPPLVLPASLAPAAAVETARVVAAGDAGAGAATAVQAVPAAALPADLPSGAPGLWESVAHLLPAALAALWLGGAALFLCWRCLAYFRMREWLLAGARPVGEAGRVRLVESPAVDAPVAFGVFDKVVALPMEFMALEDRATRDLAIEHELAHHRGRDLLANILAQPILALHWFDPLAWIGWRAMRRDQEAACDARVIAARGLGERARYGQVIASFAAGPRLALAAPMAGHFGPLTGEKSIIHRLRSLAMSEVSPRRRLAGRALLCGAALALPFTASISYAEARHGPRAPAAPGAPAPSPAPPEAERSEVFDWTDGEGRRRRVEVRVSHADDGKKVVVVEKTVTAPDAPGGKGKTTVKTYVVPAGAAAPTSAEQRRAMADMRKAVEDARAQGRDASRFGDEWAAQAAEWGEQWGKWGEEYGRRWEEWSRQWDAQTVPPAAPIAPVPPAAPPAPLAPRVTVKAAVPRAPAAPAVSFGCDGSGNPVQAESAAGTVRFTLCRQAGADNARAALQRARASIAADPRLDAETRDDVIESLEREIDRIDRNS